MIDICSYFSYNRKIILYGTGENAKRFVEKNCYNIQIICCLDKSARSGEFLQFPIRSWDDVEPGTADCVVIAASDNNIRDIYFRIIYNCDRNQLGVYDWHGVNLREVYRYEYIPYHVRPLLRPDRKELLKKEIEAHEAVSFDLFDTLIMRRVMEPEDVFKCVAAKLADDCPIKENFFLLRKECELKVNAVVHGFEAIYREMERKAGLQVHELDYVAEIEIACEKELLLPRLGMKELFDYAVSKGKKVNIVSDMYLSSEVLKDILDTLGVKGYEKIFVSCDYETSKGGELFVKYKEDVKAMSYLHIGDNAIADIENAQRHGIDAFLIPSGIDLLRASSMRKVLYYAKGDFNRRLIGECIANLFQNPFCLCRSGGKIPIATLEALVRCFIVPIVYVYIDALKRAAVQNKYDKVLLGARDGYIFNRIIQEIPIGVNPDDFVYVYISRALAFQLGMGNPEVDADYKNYLFLDNRRKIEEDEDFLLGKESIPYRKTKEHYKSYLNNLGIKLSGRYLFCDLISGGTVQHSIKPIFEQELDGFYLGRSFSYQQRKIKAVSVFERGEIPNNQLLVDILETFVVSPEPTVIGINRQGDFVFDRERRDKQELALLSEAQDEIVAGVEQLAKIANTSKNILDKRLAYILLRGLEYIEPIGQISQLKDWLYYDNNGDKVRLFA